MLRDNIQIAAAAQGDLNLSFDQLATMLGRYDRADAPCPACGPDRRHGINQRRKVLRLWRRDDELISYCCARLGQKERNRKARAKPQRPASRR
jgi:hypothetical protein